jgi:hypothetical protein
MRGADRRRDSSQGLCHCVLPFAAREMKQLLAGILMGLALWPAAAAAQAPPAPSPSAPPAATPEPDWHWSAFVSDVFDGERSIGIRRRVGHSGALFVALAYDRQRQDFGDPVTTRSRYGIVGGYRRLLGSGRLKALLELEGTFARETIDSEGEGTVSGARNTQGGGAYTGFEYFFSPAISLSARAGVAFERRDEVGGGETRQLTAFKPGLALNVYW